MNHFWARQKERISKLGARRAFGYYVAAVAERAGIGMSLAYEYGGQPTLASSPHVRFELIESMAQWKESDLVVLNCNYSPAQIEFFKVLFDRGDLCIIAREESTEIAFLGWIERKARYVFDKDRDGFRIHACYTFPDFRGSGLYPQSLDFACKYLQSNHNSTPIFIDTSVLNHASRKGIERAGFVEIGKFLSIQRWKWGWQTRSDNRPTELETAKL